MGQDGVYEVAQSSLQRLDSSPKVVFPKKLAAYELQDHVVVALTIGADGRVEKSKAVSGRVPELVEAAEKTLKHWAFQPYLVNGSAVRVRTQVSFDFDNTFDRYHDEEGEAPVRLDNKAARDLVVETVPPAYPPDARAGRIQGQVNLRVIIGKDGHLRRLHIIRGHPMLVGAAFTAVRRWTFKPYLMNGAPKTVDAEIVINFTLP